MHDVMPPLQVVPAEGRPEGTPEGTQHAASATAPARRAQVLPAAPLFARLVEDARRACRRDGVALSPAALAARIAARIGAPAEQVASRLARFAPIQPAAMATAPADHAASWRDLGSLAEEILGERERQAFFSRCLNEPGVPQPASGALGAALTARFWQTETSARRKMAIALARQGSHRPGE